MLSLLTEKVSDMSSFTGRACGYVHAVAASSGGSRNPAGAMYEARFEWYFVLPYLTGRT